jgi:hypothetical protein
MIPYILSDLAERICCSFGLTGKIVVQAARIPSLEETRGIPRSSLREGRLNVYIESRAGWEGLTF